MRKRNEKFRREFLMNSATQLYLSGTSAQVIAKELGIGYTTTRRYLKEQQEKWEQVSLVARDEFTKKELAKLNELEIESITKLGTSMDEGMISNHIRLMVTIIKRRCSLLGLDAPERIELAGKDQKPIRLRVQSLTDEELEAIAAGDA